jgi:hypothetical protein
MSRKVFVSVILGAVLLTACVAGEEAPTIPVASPSPLVLPTQTAFPPTPTPTHIPTPTTQPLSFDSATYRYESAGFELDYPTEWGEPVSMGGGDRGSIMQFRVSDEPRLDVVVLLWDPKGDLDAFLANHHVAWDASGINVVSEESATLDDGRAAARVVVQGSDGSRGFFFFTTLGDRYLQLSGGGDLELLAEISGTVRLLG